ncbi:T9SS type A sorting domain-containing protein [candidate division KSB1 bacterium]|nr:T9SS type A sorting domain-containing protein [candidate division KSB1 bacterium]
MFRTNPIIWPANNGLEFQNGFSVVNPNLIGGVLPPGTAVIFALEAVNTTTNTPLANLYQHIVNSANILPFHGKRQVPAPASLAGQSIYLCVAVQTQGAIVARPSLVEIYHEIPDSSGLGKPEPADGTGLPKTFTLYPNYPNPFNPETTVRFYLPEASEVKLTVFNIVGEIVKTLVSGRRATGNHAEMWDGRNERGEPAVSGVYFLQMRAGNFKAVQKMVLTR